MSKTSMMILMSCFVRVMRVKTCCLLIMKILANTFQKRTMSRSRSVRFPNAPTGVRICSVIHAEDDPHSTEPIPRVQAERRRNWGMRHRPRMKWSLKMPRRRRSRIIFLSHLQVRERARS